MVDSYGARYTTVQVYSTIIWLTFKEVIADRAASWVKNVTKATTCGIRIQKFSEHNNIIASSMYTSIQRQNLHQTIFSPRYINPGWAHRRDRQMVAWWV
jgi:hypothetical protein